VDLATPHDAVAIGVVDVLGGAAALAAASSRSTAAPHWQTYGCLAAPSFVAVLS
jgi:hypothetical protein